MFDKTGTLTEDGLDMKCVLPTRNDPATGAASFGDKITDAEALPNHAPILEAMASCHSITRIHGDIAGDPLDCKMFEFTDWDLHEPNPEETEMYDSFASTTVRPKATSRMRPDRLG